MAPCYYSVWKKESAERGPHYCDVVHLFLYEVIDTYIFNITVCCFLQLNIHIIDQFMNLQICTFLMVIYLSEMRLTVFPQPYSLPEIIAMLSQVLRMSWFAGKGGGMIRLRGRNRKMHEWKTLTHEPKYKHGLGASSPFWVFRGGRQRERESEWAWMRMCRFQSVAEETGRVRYAVFSVPNPTYGSSRGWSSNDMGLVRLGSEVNRKCRNRESGGEKTERLLKDTNDDSTVWQRDSIHIKTRLDLCVNM